MALTTSSTKTAEYGKAASPVRQVGMQTMFELLLTLRRGENVLVTLIVPVLLLIFFTSLNIVPAVNGSAINFLLPGIIALAIIAAGMVNLGIATAYERYYGVLKRLGSSPLSRGGLIVAKVISILILEAVQVVVLVGVAMLLYGWRPAGSFPLALLAIALGTVTFSALGLVMAGTLRAEMTLAGANALFLLFMLIGGGILPLDHLPGPIAAFAQFLPAAALTQSLQATFVSGGIVPVGALVTLGVWGAIFLLVAVWFFKWE